VLCLSIHVFPTREAKDRSQAEPVACAGRGFFQPPWPGHGRPAGSTTWSAVFLPAAKCETAPARGELRPLYIRCHWGAVGHPVLSNQAAPAAFVPKGNPTPSRVQKSRITHKIIDPDFKRFILCINDVQIWRRKWGS
jgi:hypothetical protein